ncbi:MmgE/PrpD family protein [Rummeliibacillus sp. SL167]|uniref:MmgE/PrpD family protein n=1 Tax=Rummeliibacillus sp. SL167 TaxID=2579792 RepID=UPI0011B55BA3|nr:MmgE/PrpD family protein [Rummeliibacillus sp. SL167]
MEVGLTTRLSQSIFQSNPNDAAIQAAKSGLLDYLVSSYASRKDKGVLKLLKLLEKEGGAEVAPLIGLEKKATPQQAALVNGFLGHALDFDDVHTEVRGHPSSVILPVLLAIAATQNVTGHRFLAAYCVGVEVMARLGQSVTNDHYEKGWHNTATLGVFAATAAGAYLLQMSTSQIAQALGFAATQSSGLRLHFGTETKPLHAGLAARAAILALQLTTVDFKDNVKSFDGKLGFFNLYEGKKQEEVSQYLLKGWGKSWRIVKPGLWFKIYPFCSAAYYGVDAALKIGPISNDVIKKIQIVFSNNSDAALIHREPETGEQGRFSIEYIVSLIFSGEELTLREFRDFPIPTEVKKMMGKIKRSHQPILANEKRFTKINVLFKNGEERTAISYSPKGSPENRVTDEDLIQKCHTILNDEEKEKRWLDLIFSLENSANLELLLEEL